ncbi:PhoH-like protein [Vibrio phage 1.101.O._10N.261.45.C6]|nr:PhoH-like protein [Vibrio phage 1.101.O._10N.261.45.C6]
MANTKRHANRNRQQDKTGCGKVKNTSHESGKVVKEKFQERRESSLPPIQAKTKKQKQYLNLLKTCNILVVEGIFGTGKSYCAAATAADALRKGEVEKVIVARPYVQTGKTSGFKPGSSLEKLYPYVRNILDTMKSRLGDGAYNIALRDGLTGTIEVQEVESIRGRSFDTPSFLIIDEAQQTTPEEMLSIVTRISDNCTLVLCGDDSQKDIRGQSGLNWFKEFALRHQLQGVGFVEFNDFEDIVRGGMVKDIAIGLAKDKGE